MLQSLQVGDAVPDIRVPNQDGAEISPADFKGKKLVVFFYPKANTPGCTAEACDLRDHYAELQNKGYALLGVSADSPAKQKNFKEKYQFPFDLLADEKLDLVKAFGVWGEKKFMGKTYDGIHRMTFLADEKGIIQRVIDKVKTKDHAAQILDDAS